jgi:hypothetical protein
MHKMAVLSRKNEPMSSWAGVNLVTKKKGFNQGRQALKSK